MTATFILSNIYCAAIVAAFAQSAAFGAGSTVPDVNILRNGISFEATLRLDGCTQGIGDILADDAAGAVRTRLVFERYVWLTDVTAASMRKPRGLPFAIRRLDNVNDASATQKCAIS